MGDPIQITINYREMSKNNLKGRILEKEFESLGKTEKKKQPTKKLVDRLYTEEERAKARIRLAGAIHDKNLVKNVGRGHKIQDEIDLYVRQVLDPFNTYNAVVPDVHSYPTTTFSVHTPLTLTTDANGRFCLFVRDGITYHYASNSTSAPLVYDAGWEVAVSTTDWFAGNEQAAIRGAFSAYRPVAMGVRAVYDAAPTDAAGRVAMGYFPGTQALPSTVDSDSSYALTYDAFSQYQGVITGAAISGATVTWRPMTPQNHFRPTKTYVYKGTTDSFDELTYEGRTTTWDIDPEVCAAMQGVGLADNSKLSPDQDTPSAAAELMAITLPFNSPMLVIMGEGLPASTQVMAAEIVAHYEGVADNRGFSLVQAQNRIHRPGGMEKAVHRINKVHPAHSGGSVQAHTSWLDQALKITQGIAGVVNTGAGIINSVPRVVQPLLEAAETVAALI